MSGNHASRVFEINSAVTASISGLTIRDGLGSSTPTSGGIFFGGGILNAGALTLSHMAITDNSAPAGINPGTGGGIWNTGSLAVTDSVLSGNTSGHGGAIFSTGLGSASITRCNFTNNSADLTGGGVYSVTSLTLSDSIFSGNTTGGAGGGMYAISAAPLSVSDCTFVGNTATGDPSSFSGGGISFSGPSLTVTSSSFSNNSALNGDGGGLLCGTNTGGAPGIFLNACSISSNSASNNGGGIYSRGDNNVTVNNCSIDNNEAGASGGGIWVNHATVTGSTITLNSARDGGGIFTARGLEVLNTTVSANTAESRGGGLCADPGLILVIASTVSSNSANDGGGIWTRSELAMSNTTIADNIAAGSGGGVYGISAGEFRNVTVAANRSNTSGSGGSGGGMWLDPVSQSLQLTNTIVAGNLNGPAPATTADDVAGALNTASAFNLIGTGGTGGLQNRTADPLHNNQVAATDPGLGSLGDYGGTTQTIPLLPGSPAIGRGGKGLATSGMLSVVSTPPTLSSTIMTTDQRGDGFARFYNGTVDIGAYQSQLAPLRARIAVTTTADSSPGSLRQAIQDNNWSGGGNTIDFSLPAGSTITLISGELLIVQDLTISGPGAGQLAVSGNHASRVFDYVGYGRYVEGPSSISGLTIRDGSVGSSLFGGGLSMTNGGILSVTNCTFTGNSADSGGAIFNTLGLLTVSGCVFSGNTATARGGAVYEVRPSAVQTRPGSCAVD